MKGAFVSDNICGNFVKGRHMLSLFGRKKSIVEKRKQPIKSIRAFLQSNL
jgi:hypothetical protein